MGTTDASYKEKSPYLSNSPSIAGVAYDTWFFVGSTATGFRS